MPWLAGRRALIMGDGEAVLVVADALGAAGADVVASAIGPDGEHDFDILVHGGASGGGGEAAATGLDAWRGSVSSTIDGCFLESAEFARRCIAAGRSGAILFLLPSGGDALQATVVGALGNLVKTLAVEWARDGIRVNAIASRICEPGGLGDPAVRASLGHLAAYLASDYGAYVSGMVMGIDEA
jgi:NAD(P)-dependent dehydrogenase (short-subunit alcohol dehydrogenase family)